MLVALPSAIAFGVTIYGVLGGAHAAAGALAGILGATALGLIAPLLGGTNRLITAPCAPAAAVLTAFAIGMLQSGANVDTTLLFLMLLGVMAGILQVIFGVLRLGSLIKYMPYPVVSGYLSGVGLIIIGSQLPKMLGAAKGMVWWEALVHPAGWDLRALAVGAVTATVMVWAPRLTKNVPAAILGLIAGIAMYFALSYSDPELRSLTGNALVIGTLSSGDVSFTESVMVRFNALVSFDIGQVGLLLVPALTLAVLLSIDTLKTCVVLDALTRSRHDSNRELVGQGLGNIASGIVGGIPGAGTMGATLVNISSGAATRASGLAEGALALVAFLALGGLIAWIPVASLAAILIVIGVRMIDTNSFHMLKSRGTILDFVVIVSVIVVALTVSLIAASGVGVVLAVLLFVREQVGGSVVHRKLLGNQTFSKRVRRREEMAILHERGDQTAVVELQGSLFFGTANQLYLAIEPELKTRKYLILDMRRVQTVDVTAAHMLEQVKDMLGERQGYLIFSQIPQSLPTGKDVQQYFDQLGIARPGSPVKVFGELDEALEWVEDRIIEESGLGTGDEHPIALSEIELFKSRKTETLAALESCMEARSYKAGEKIFRGGDTGDELYLIRRGAVSILLPLENNRTHHLGTFARGAFFGEMGFLDGAPRSADAVAFADTDLFVLSRRTFDRFAEEHRKVALNLMEGLASVLSSRLRYTNAELSALES